MDGCTNEERARLSLLLQWKQRLRYCDEKGLESCFQNYPEILSKAFLTIQDSVCRRSLFLVLERLTLLCWQESQFGRKQLTNPYASFVTMAYEAVRELTGKITFNKTGYWFGGISVGKTAGYNLSSTTFISICIHLIALSTSTDIGSSVNNFLLYLSESVETSQDLAIRLIEHDERCLSAAVALLHISNENISLPHQFNPQQLFLNMLLLIDFDHSVALDWLHSETVSIAFILRFMKDFQIHPDAYDYSTLHYPVYSREAKKFRRPTSFTCEDFIIVNIRQMHGEQMVSSRFKFPKIETPACFDETMELNNDRKYGLQNLFDFTHRLRQTCQRLMKVKIAPFNMDRLIKEMKAVEEVLEKLKKTETKKIT